MEKQYIRLKIAKTVSYRGKVLVPNNEILVDEQAAADLVERGMAEFLESVPNQQNSETGDELEEMSVDELKEYAQEAGIEVESLTDRAEILQAIKEAIQDE